MTASIGDLLAALRARVGHLGGDTLGGALVLLVLHLAAGQVLSRAVVRAIRAVLACDRNARVDRLAAAFAAQLARVFNRLHDPAQRVRAAGGDLELHHP